MNQDQLKSLLLDIENTELEFSLILTGKESKKVNGLYKPELREILIHNKNFKNDNALIYTAIHEYAHHLLNEERINSGAHVKKYARVHSTEFWARFHGLLEKAEAKGYYVIGIEQSKELSELTDIIRKNYLERNGELMREFGKLLMQAHSLCVQEGIRYEDYIDRVLRLPRNAAQSIARVASLPLNPAMGFDNMKLVSQMGSEAKRAEASEKLLEGQSPDSVRFSMRKKAAEIDQKTQLQKEKQRLEKTISQLSARLEQVEESLANL